MDANAKRPCLPARRSRILGWVALGVVIAIMLGLTGCSKQPKAVTGPQADPDPEIQAPETPESP